MQEAFETLPCRIMHAAAVEVRDHHTGLVCKGQVAEGAGPGEAPAGIGLEFGVDERVHRHGGEELVQIVFGRDQLHLRSENPSPVIAHRFSLAVEIQRLQLLDLVGRRPDVRHGEDDFVALAVSQRD